MTRALTGLLLAPTLLLAGSASATPAGQTTVLPPKEAAALSHFYFNADKKSKEIYWTPTAADVASAEAALALSAKTPMPHKIGRPKTFVLAHYCRQYAGVSAGGRRQILINGFASYPPPDPQWRHRAVLVFDGGFSFFHGAYDPATHQIVSLEFNGPYVAR